MKTESNKDRVGSFYHFALTTGADDPTGTYSATISVGGVSFSKTLPVETIKPNRLKISVDFGVTELTTSPTRGSSTSRGSTVPPAGDMNADVSVRFSSRVPTPFSGWKGYVFDDPVRSFRAETREVFNGKLDSNGKAGFTMGLSAGAVAPGKLQASFRTRVFEPGGNINTDTLTLPFHPYAEYAGVRIPDAEKGWLDVDQPHKVQVALVGDTGTPVAAGEVEIEVYEIGWRWWWDREDDDIAEYLGSRDYALVSSERVKVTNGAAEWTLKFKERVWGRYLVRVRDTKTLHATGQVVYMRCAGWYYTSPGAGRRRRDVLVFSPHNLLRRGRDREGHHPHGGTGPGARLHREQREAPLHGVDRDPHGRDPLRPQADPGHVAQRLRARLPGPAARADRQRPSHPHVRHHPPPGGRSRHAACAGIVTADVYEPESTVNVTVSEKSGRAMTYTLAIVDEGLLNLTRYDARPPRALLQARRARREHVRHLRLRGRGIRRDA